MLISGRSTIACRKRWSTPMYPADAASSSLSGGTSARRDGSRMRSFMANVGQALSPANSCVVRPLLCVFYHVHRNLSRNFPMQPQRHLEFAQRLNGLIQSYLAAVDCVTLLLQRIRDIFRRHRSEELVVLTSLLLNRNADTRHHFAQFAGIGNQFGFLAQMTLTLLLHNLLIGFRGCHGQPFGQQKIAGVARRNLHQLAAHAEFLHEFSEYDFHDDPSLNSAKGAARSADRKSTRLNSSH